jgi:Trk-type K+ transport system membrane component
VFLSSLFQSVTARTCGFNTVDIGQLTNASILLLMVLMFIGASPGSTGGGIKTTSFTLLLLMIRNRLKGQEQVNVFNRTIPAEILGRTIAIIFASAFTVVLVTSVLLILGGVDMSPLSSRHLFAEYLFESVSAYGTVGLSMNLTAKLERCPETGHRLHDVCRAGWPVDAGLCLGDARQGDHLRGRAGNGGINREVSYEEGRCHRAWHFRFQCHERTVRKRF